MSLLECTLRAWTGSRTLASSWSRRAGTRSSAIHVCLERVTSLWFKLLTCVHRLIGFIETGVTSCIFAQWQQIRRLDLMPAQVQWTEAIWKSILGTTPPGRIILSVSDPSQRRKSYMQSIERHLVRNNKQG